MCHSAGRDPPAPPAAVLAMPAGLGVAKFLVQLGVFASVLYTLLALDIDPVEQLVKLLPISEVRIVHREPCMGPDGQHYSTHLLEAVAVTVHCKQVCSPKACCLCGLCLVAQLMST